MVRSTCELLLTTSIGTVFLLYSLSVSFAQVMQSTNYQIQSDSVNMGGGLSTSTNYRSESTVGEVASGVSSSTNYQLRAGYQQMQEVYIAISSSGDVNLSPAISGLAGGTANGSTTVTVITDSSAGYSLSIKSAGNPAMQKSPDAIADYAPAGASPDYAFSIAASEAQFGYSPEGVHIVQRFKDNGATCNVGSLDTGTACWDALSTSDFIIASDTNANHPLGSTTTVQFRVGIGSSVVQPEGIYTATTTLTALPL